MTNPTDTVGAPRERAANRGIDDQRTELLAAFAAAFSEAGSHCPDQFAQLAVAVVCANTTETLDLIAFEDAWIAQLLDCDASLVG